jgi:hypothetical protein
LMVLILLFGIIFSGRCINHGHLPKLWAFSLYCSSNKGYPILVNQELMIS